MISITIGILLKYNPSLLVQNGGPVELNKFWAHSLMKRMKFVQRKATTSKSKCSLVDFKEKKGEFLDAVAKAVVMEDDPSRTCAELGPDWHEPSSKLGVDDGEARREAGGDGHHQRQMADHRCLLWHYAGRISPCTVNLPGKTRFSFLPDWHITHSPNHWLDECTMLDYINHMIVPYLLKTRECIGEDKTALVIIGNFKAQVMQSVIQLLEDNDVHVCTLPPNTTDLLQLMDISINKPAKNYLRAHFDEWYSQEVMKQPVMKEVSARWLVDVAGCIGDNPQLIVNGLLRSGITGAFDKTLDDVLEEEGDSGNESSREGFSSDEEQ